ncbi:MAG: class I SAM-dependent methyltransferase [Phycisphaerales bacterium]|nr:class I SAM-dependent methyltransferase [Phycisphaerales bacterium]
MKRPTDAEVRRTYLQGPEGVRQAGHREYVGGLWDEVGRLQLRFLRGRGLRREHRLLDIGCGALRGGVHLIRYLEPGCYIGVDKEPDLLRIGAEQEVGPAIMSAKQPTLLALAGFEFDRLPARPDIAWAHSLFTHLPMEHIRRCLANLRMVMPDGVLYATFGECDEPKDNPGEPHDHRLFEYTRAEMAEAGRATGWVPEHLGKWGHPRGHRMLKLTPVPTTPTRHPSRRTA